MNLNEYRAAVRGLLAVNGNWDLSIYTDPLIDEALRQALREYQECCPAEQALLDVMGVASHELSLAALARFHKLVAVAWPWDGLHGVPAELAQRIVRWRWMSEDRIYIEDGELQPGDQVLVYYQPTRAIQDLDGALATTVRQPDETLLALGSAGWAGEMHVRQMSDALNGPAPARLRGLCSWSAARLQEFRERCASLARRGQGPVRPGWKEVGL